MRTATSSGETAHRNIWNRSGTAKTEARPSGEEGSRLVPDNAIDCNSLVSLPCASMPIMMGCLAGSFRAIRSDRTTTLLHGDRRTPNSHTRGLSPYQSTIARFFPTVPHSLLFSFGGWMHAGGHCWAASACSTCCVEASLSLRVGVVFGHGAL